MAGPVELALQRLLADALRNDAALQIDPAQVLVQLASPSAPAEFKVDARPLLGDLAHGRDALATLTERWRRLPSVRHVVAVPPALYISPSLQLLHLATTHAIATSGTDYGSHDRELGRTSVVSFSSPNINKPLHVGHLRNNFLGMSLARLLRAQGCAVRKDDNQSNWGVHICQAVLAYQLWGDGRTPASARVKGDHLVGELYVRFHEENARLRGTDERTTPLDHRAQELLRRMEAGDQELIDLNQLVTGWARAGITETYRRIATEMDFVVQERDTLEVARSVVARGLQRGLCLRRDDGSVYVDLRNTGNDPVTLIRQDGTPVVYFQHMGSRVHRYDQLDFDRVLMVMGLEWRSGNKMVEGALMKLGYDWASRIEPVHYGMVVLPEGKMRSRSGTGVQADAVLDRFSSALARGWTSPDTPADAKHRACERLAVALLKLYFLGHPRHEQVSYDEPGIWRTTLPRLNDALAVLRHTTPSPVPFQETELAADDDHARRLLLRLNAFPRAVHVAYERREPAHLVRELHDLVGLWHRWQRIRPVPPSVTEATATVMRAGLALLNVELPDDLGGLPPRLATDPGPAANDRGAERPR